jgi:hypothetical protein
LRALQAVFERNPDMDEFERDLINDTRDRIVKYGVGTRLSEKAEAIILVVYLRSCGPLGIEK